MDQSDGEMHQFTALEHHCWLAEIRFISSVTLVTDILHFSTVLQVMNGLGVDAPATQETPLVSMYSFLVDFLFINLMRRLRPRFMSTQV
jgi:hypothetical protein